MDSSAFVYHSSPPQSHIAPQSGLHQSTDHSNLTYQQPATAANATKATSSTSSRERHRLEDIHLRNNESHPYLSGKRKLEENQGDASAHQLEDIATQQETAQQSDDSEQQVGLKLLFAASLLQSKEPSTSALPESHQAPTPALASPPQTTTAEVAVTVPPKSPLPNAQGSTLKMAYCEPSPQQHPQQATPSAPPTPDRQAGVSLSPVTASPYVSTLAEGTVVLQPSHLDVLCGRGGLINKHPGNIVYRRVVDHNKGLYKQVPKRHRILVSQSIVQTIQNHGGRFLQNSAGQGKTATGGSSSSEEGWVCISFRRAVQKTSQALREPTQPTTGGGEGEEGAANPKEGATTAPATSNFP